LLRSTDVYAYVEQRPPAYRGSDKEWKSVADYFAAGSKSEY